MNIKPVLPIILMFMAGCLDNWSPRVVEESKRRGHTINTALHLYKIENTMYPATLEPLIPKYIKVIEPPVAGNGKWVYEIYNNGQQYNLGFRSDSDREPECWYDSETNSWGCDTK